MTERQSDCDDVDDDDDEFIFKTMSFYIVDGNGCKHF